MAAWDTTCCGEHLGGIWWNQLEQKATASNAGPVIAGVRLAERTADTLSSTKLTASESR